MKKPIFLAIFAAFSALTGCARNADLELVVSLPAATTLSMDGGVGTDGGTGGGTGPELSYAMIAVLRGNPLSGADSMSQLFTTSGSGNQGVFNIALGPTVTTQPVSVLANGNFTDPVSVLVRLCAHQQNCEGGTIDDTTSAVREFWWKIDRAFYQKQVTKLGLPVPTDSTGGLGIDVGAMLHDSWAEMLPASSNTPTVIEVPKCDVAGCVGGNPQSYCPADGVTHACEAP